jgi:hypothetical protein
MKMGRVLIVFALVVANPAYAKPDTWTCYFKGVVGDHEIIVVTLYSSQGIVYSDNKKMEKPGIVERGPVTRV